MMPMQERSAVGAAEPAVSIVIPTYKHRDLVRTTLDSVFAQTFTDYEVIVVNDGSPDDTSDVLRPLAEAGRIRYLEQKNAGQSAARNRGIAEARGEFVALLDDDDLWPADNLEWQVAALRQQPNAVLCYGGVSNFHGAGVPSEEETNLPLYPGPDGPSGDALNAFLWHNWLFSPGQALFRRAALERIGGLDVSVAGSDDYDLYIRLARLGPFAYQDRRALYYRLHGANASRNIPAMYHRSGQVRRKHLGMPFLGWLPRPGSAALWQANYRYLQDVYTDMAINTIGDILEGRTGRHGGDIAQARRLWLFSVRAKPLLLTRRHTFYLLRRLLRRSSVETAATVTTAPRTGRVAE